MQGFARRTLTFASLSALLMAGCVPKPFGYESIRDSELYISRPQLEAIVEERLGRNEIVAQLGPPDAENVEAHSIGYQRCVTSKGYNITIPPSRPEIVSCQRVGIWFDDEERAVAWKEARSSINDNPYKSSLREWIQVPERHTNRDLTR